MKVIKHSFDGVIVGAGGAGLREQRSRQLLT